MSLDLNRIKAICFDVDGTLSDTDDLWVQSFSRIFRPLNVIVSERRVTAFARWGLMVSETPGNLVYHLLDRFDLDDDVARLFNFISRYGVDRRPSKFWIVPLVQEMLATLQIHFPLAIVSARGSSTYRFLEQFELTPYFKAIAISDTCRYTKPFPDPIVWAAQQMHVEPCECLMVGDTTVDIKAGRAAGAQTVGVLCGFGQEKELRRVGADLVLPSTADLAMVLLGHTIRELQSTK
ncbi:MAG: HAD family hydrolase [Anaerolineae bacterium]|nr:HAD family hydrolase [Anaerolineae bacterium]